jgi:tRNA modification GTPase
MSRRNNRSHHGDNDTIVAVITPPGEGGIAALRLAGDTSRIIVSKFFRSHSKDRVALLPFVMRYGHFYSSDNVILDEVMVVHMPAGRSYTGLEQVEIYCHGGRHVVRLILDQLVKAGARTAEPGEFTRLAFLNGRIDLACAEAVAEMIASDTEASFRASREHLLGAYTEHIEKLRDELVRIVAEIEASIDFPEEEITTADRDQLLDSLKAIQGKIKSLVESYSSGRIVKEGFKVAICGRPNAGKSSLFNLLLKQERALVHPEPGTTRDYLSEWIELDGVAVNLIDTAGLRTGGGSVEKKGQERARKIIDDSDLVIWVADLSDKTWQSRLKIDIKSLSHNEIIVTGNKVDLFGARSLPNSDRYLGLLAISCRSGTGISHLKKALSRHVEEHLTDLTSGMVVTSSRHRQKLAAALGKLKSVSRKIKSGESAELIAFDLREAINCLDEITGKVYTEQILDQIFGKFCIGK